MSGFDGSSSSCTCWPRPAVRARPAPDELPGHRAPRQPGVAGRHGRRGRRPRSSCSSTRGTVTATGWIVMLAGAAGRRRGRPVRGPAGADDRDAAAGVSLFNAVGGGAAALVAVYGYIDGRAARHRRARYHLGVHRAGHAHRRGDVLRVDDRRRQAAGLIPGQPIIFPGARLVNLAPGRRRASAAAVYMIGHAQRARAADRGAWPRWRSA